MTIHHGREVAELDPVFAVLVETHGPCPLPSRGTLTPYQSLFRSIIYQQLSGKAAGTILGRVLVACGDPDTMPEPKILLAQTDDTLRACGLSRQKMAALHDLAARTLDGTVPEQSALAHLDNQEIITRLTTVRGIGQWTVEVYLMHTAGRPDVWPVDDLGVRKGWMLAHGLAEMPKPKPFKDMANHLRPWRSQAAWYCWRAADTVTPS
jgi:DNA-3-methyladenine glycosylase II